LLDEFYNEKASHVQRGFFVTTETLRKKEDTENDETLNFKP
jgi:hypothetical protein